MTAIQIALFIQLLIAFNVPPATVQNIDNILTQSAATQSITVQATTTTPVDHTGPLPTAPVQTTPATTASVTPTAPAQTITTAAQAATTPTTQQAPAVTITQGTGGVAFLTAGADPIELSSITVSVNGNPSQVSPVTVSIGSLRLENMFGSDTEDTIKVWPTATWYIPHPINRIAAGSTIEIDVNAPGATGSAVVGFVGTDMRTGDDISQHVTVGANRF